MAIDLMLGLLKLRILWDTRRAKYYAGTGNNLRAMSLHMHALGLAMHGTAAAAERFTKALRRDGTMIVGHE